MEGTTLNYYALILCVLGRPNPINKNTRIYPTVEESLAYMCGKGSLESLSEEVKTEKAEPMQICFF